MTSCASLKATNCGYLSHSAFYQCLSVSFSYLNWEATPEFPNPPSPSLPSIPGANLHTFLDISLCAHDKGRAEGARGSLAQGALATMPLINLTLNLFKGGQAEKSWKVSSFLPIFPIFYLSSGWIPPSPCPQLALPGSVLLTLAPPPQGQAKLLQ